MKISTENYIIGGGISVFLVILITLVVILTKPIQDSDGDNPPTDPPTNPPITDPDEIPLPFTNALIVKINNSALWARDIDGDSSMFLFRNWTTPFHSFDFYHKKNIFFVSTAAGQPITSYSKQFFQLTQPGNWYATKIAADYVHEKVYVLDELATKVNVFDIRSGCFNVIFTELIKPRDIAIDPVHRCLFILQLASILTTSLDGSSPKAIVEKTDILAFQVDADQKRIYWATASDIESADYAGKNFITVKKVTTAVVSLAVLNNKLYWLNPATDYKKSTLWFCKVIDGVCKDKSNIVFDDNAVEIKAYSFKQSQVSDPCKSGSNCEHMCINSDNEPRCVCAMDWQLKNDSKSCEKIDTFLLYVQGDFVKGRVLEFSNDGFSAALLPFQLNITLNRNEVVSIDFHTRNRELIFSDDRSVSKINLRPGSQQLLMGGGIPDKQVNPAVDWTTGNVYFVRNYSWSDKNIAVRKIDPHDDSTVEKLILYIIIKLTPKSLVVHPNRGFLFVTLSDPAHKEEVKMVRANMDGTDPTTLGTNLSISELENGLAMDYEEDRLFWFDKDMKMVHSANLECSNLQTINVSIVEKPTMINVYGDYMYISNLTSIWRFNKKNGRNSRKILPKFKYESQPIRGAKVFSTKSQLIGNHPCSVNNGGCKRYCFAIPNKASGKFSGASELEKVCGCNDGEGLDPDGINCSPYEIATRQNIY